MAISPGTRLGPYDILGPIGSGGMGEVYRARDTRLDRTVAIKVLPDRFAGRDDLRQRLEREARAVSSLNHPHICTLYDIGHQDGIDYLVMEYLEGETLAARIARGPLSLEEVLRFGIQIAEALERAHRQHMTHRDLKPANIMLTKSGAKLLDFGLAKVQPNALTVDDETRTEALTSEGAILGTFQYMAPEQLEGGAVDGRTDIFAFGAVLYEMATGLRAFEGKTVASCMAAILKNDPPSISAVQNASPPGLDRIVRACLEKDPDERWQSIRDVLRELRWVGQPAPAPIEVKRKSSWERAIWASVTGALAVALALLFWMRPHSGNPDQGVVQFDVFPEEGPLGSPLAGNPLAISPDGKLLAYVAATNQGRRVLWIRPLDSSSARPLPETEGAFYPFWSPDSRSIGFFAQGKLKRVDVAGGPAQPLADAVTGRGGAWGRGGVIVFAPTPEGPLYRVSTSGAALGRATDLDSSRQDNSHRWPAFLPDGNHFLFCARAASREQTGVYVGSLDSKQSKQILQGVTNAAFYSPQQNNSGFLLIVRSNTLHIQPFDAASLQLSGEAVPMREQIAYSLSSAALFSISANGALAYRGKSATFESQLAWMDRAGKRLAIVGNPADYRQIALAPDERTVAVSHSDAETGSDDIWMLDLVRGAAARFTADPLNDWFPVWSSDSSRVIFASDRDGGWSLFEKPVTGTAGERRILKSLSPTFATSWSPDGRFVIYHGQAPESNNDLMLFPVAGGQPVPFLRTQFNETHGVFSADGRWVAYSSDETRTSEVYIQRFDTSVSPPRGAGKWQISTSGGLQPQWRRDGKELYYCTLDRKLMAVDISTSADSLKAGLPHPLFEIQFDASPTSSVAYAPSRDGQRFLVIAPVDNARPSPITVVVNWAANLKR